jgi:hypothetical protein
MMNQIGDIRMVRRHLSTRPFLMLAVALLASGACNSTSGPITASGVTAVSGNDQFAATGSPAANPLVVLVTDQNGSVFPGGTVRWTIVSGGGTVSDTTSTSDANGHASIAYTAGASPGVATIVATVEQIWTAQFTIHVVAP